MTFEGAPSVAFTRIYLLGGNETVDVLGTVEDAAIKLGLDLEDRPAS